MSIYPSIIPRGEERKDERLKHSDKKKKELQEKEDWKKKCESWIEGKELLFGRKAGKKKISFMAAIMEEGKR